MSSSTEQSPLPSGAPPITESPAVHNPQSLLTADMTLDDFLRAYPWPEEWRKYKPMDFLWTFELKTSVESIWPFLIDTSTFNKMMDYPEMHFEERDGKLYGSSRNAGILMEWEEVPWQWQYGRYMVNARIYSKGFARYVRAYYILRETEPGKSRLKVYFGWVPRGVMGRAILKLGMPALEKSYGKAMNKVQEAVLARDAVALIMDEPHEYSDSAKTKIASVRKEMEKVGVSLELFDKIMEYVRTTNENELDRIRVLPLAREWGLPDRDVLGAFLHMSRQGLFTFTWDVICPHCRGVRQEIDHLWELPEIGECDACDIDFAATGLDSLEVTFHIHPSIRQVEKKFYCSAGAAQKPHILLQSELKPGEKRILDPVPPPSTYRARLLGEKDYSMIEIGAEQGARHLQVDGGGAIVQGQAKSDVFVLENKSNQPQMFVLEQNKTDTDVLRPALLFNFQEFRESFAEETLASGINLDVGVQTILFTDVVGSTRFYQEAGDSGAFAKIQEQFVKIYEIVQTNEGAVVKTIGDAAMAAFFKPSQAMAASIAMQRAFSPEAWPDGLRLRISLNTGPCLAVKLNSGIDYFGNTVNLSAKLQSFAEGGQIAFSRSLVTDKETAQLIKKEGFPLYRVKAENDKNFTEADEIYRIKVWQSDP